MSLCFEAEATIDVQGTSSQWYVIKNFKTKTSDTYQIALDQIATKVLCFKADYAEATGTHNTGTANFVTALYDTKVPPQENDERVRTTIYGHPGVIFHKKDNSSEPTFVGKYNFNHDKGSEETFGFTSDYPDVQSVEFCNNTSDACLFHGPIPSDWSDDFEFRYPDGHNDISAFKEMHDWVVSTYQVDATGSALGTTYFGVDGDQYTHDTAEYRLAKFKKEFEEYFDMEYALVYYVYTFFALMVDQRAKNLFLTSWDKKKWFCYFYDNDTIFGINNQGDLVLDYYYEDKDQLGDAYVFNGATSTLWVNFKEAFPDKIQEKYRKLRSDGKLTKEKLEEAYITNQADKWSISIYNEDSDYKYISMLRSDNDASNLGQVRGNGVEHLHYILDNRFVYCDSMWHAGNDADYNYPEDYISLRIYTPVDENDNPRTDLAVAPNANITATYFSNMYGGAKYKANGTLLKEKVTANAPVTFVPPVNPDTGVSEKFNNTETAVFGASQLSSLGDLSALYCGSVKVPKAEKLTELIIGSGTDGYRNENLWELEVGTNKLLKKIDVRNCPKLVTPLALANCPNIQEIYATGSGITGVELPSSGYLKKVYLPETLTNLTITNQQYIEEFQLDGCENLTTLRVEKSPNVPVEQIVSSASRLNRIRLLDVDMTIYDEEILARLNACGGLDESGLNTNRPVVTGKITVDTVISASKVDYWKAAFPNVEFTFKLLGYLVTFKDYDGTVLKEQSVISGGNANPPSAPSRDSTEQYDYHFNGWDNSYQNITADTICTATYGQTLRKYTVKFYNGTTLVEEKLVDYGTAATYTGSSLTKTHTDPDIYYWILSGWYPHVSNITKDTSTYAQWEEKAYPVFQTVYPPTDMHNNLLATGDIIFAFDDSLVLLSENDIYYTSTDMANWSAHTVTKALYDSDLSNIVYLNGYYITITSTSGTSNTYNIVYSTDGVNWQYGANLGNRYGISGITWDGTNFIAVGYDNIYVISEDLTTLVATYTYNGLSSDKVQFDDVTNRVYIMSRTGSDSYIHYSGTKDSDYLSNITTTIEINEDYQVDEAVIIDGVINCIYADKTSTSQNVYFAQLNIDTENNILTIVTSDTVPDLTNYNIHYCSTLYKPADTMITCIRSDTTKYGDPYFMLVATLDGKSFITKDYPEINSYKSSLYATSKYLIVRTDTPTIYYAVNTL